MIASTKCVNSFYCLYDAHKGEVLATVGVIWVFRTKTTGLGGIQALCDIGSRLGSDTIIGGLLGITNGSIIFESLLCGMP